MLYVSIFSYLTQHPRHWKVSPRI